MKFAARDSRHLSDIGNWNRNRAGRGLKSATVADEWLRQSALSPGIINYAEVVRSKTKSTPQGASLAFIQKVFCHLIRFRCSTVELKAKVNRKWTEIRVYCSQHTLKTCLAWKSINILIQFDRIHANISIWHICLISVRHSTGIYLHMLKSILNWLNLYIFPHTLTLEFAPTKWSSTHCRR